MKSHIVIFCMLVTSVVFGQDWQKNFTEALAMANDKNRPLVLVFAGSDWCGPCIKLDKKIWKSSEFKDYSEENYILYKADFPRKKANKLSDTLAKQNDDLAEKYNPSGHFPLVVMLDQNGVVQGKTGYANTAPSEYILLLNSFLK